MKVTIQQTHEHVIYKKDKFNYLTIRTYLINTLWYSGYDISCANYSSSGGAPIIYEGRLCKWAKGYVNEEDAITAELESRANDRNIGEAWDRTSKMYRWTREKLAALVAERKAKRHAPVQLQFDFGDE